MSTPHIRIGFGRKIGYSCIGLLAGNAVSLLLLLLIALTLRAGRFNEIRTLWNLDFGDALCGSFVI